MSLSRRPCAKAASARRAWSMPRWKTGRCSATNGRRGARSRARAGRACTNSRSAARWSMPATRCRGWSRCSARSKASPPFPPSPFPTRDPARRKSSWRRIFRSAACNSAPASSRRLTSGLAAPKDRSLTIVGDKGSIVVRDLWDNRSAVYLEELGQPRKLTSRLGVRAEAWLKAFIPWKPLPGRRLPYPSGKRHALPCRLSLADRFLPGDRGAGARRSQPARSRSSRATAPCISPRSRWR